MKKKIIIIILGIVGILVVNYLKSGNDTNNESAQDIIDDFDNHTVNSEENNSNMENQDSKTTKSDKVTIGFYNVENLFDIYDDPQTSDNEFTPYGEKRWDETRYEDKLNAISDVILDMDGDNGPAFLGLAEIENYEVLEDLIKTRDLKNNKYKIIHADNSDTRGIDVAAIYRSDIFEKIDYTYYKVPDLHTRDILHVEGKIYGQATVHYFVTHWPSRRKGTKETEYKRIEVAKLLRSKIDNLLEQNPNERIIVMGDFNDEPSNKAVKQILAKSDFYNLYSRFESGDGTVNHQGEWLVFDQILVSKPLLDDKNYNLTKKSGFIYNDESVTFTHRDGNTVPSRTYGGPKYYGGTSDHYAVYLKMTVKH